MEIKISQLIEKLTLEEKISLLAGKDMWHTVPIPRLNIPSIRVSDGPSGVRGTDGNYSPTSACFPCGSALGATWNTDLVEQIGNALADEVKAKSAHILLAPTVNIHRSPIAGRNFECFSEDPYLTGQMASAYINGLQKKGVGACIKHYVCNDQEFERHSISSEVQERPLHEIYLEPFRIAMQEARPWAVMSAYNKINGISANAHDHLLKDILKDGWGFDGVVISDWFGTYDPSTASGQLDVEMPGPARWASPTYVKAALGAGLISEENINEKVRRILLTVARVGAFENPDYEPERAEDIPEHRKLLREAAGEAIVLLKNEEDLLPLQPGNIRKLLVVGENTVVPQIVGGGSAHVTPHYVVSPLEGIQQHVGDSVEVEYTLGCLTQRSLPSVSLGWCTTNDGEQGLALRVFDNLTFDGEPVLEKTVKRTTLAWFGNEHPAPGLDVFSIRMEGFINPTESGRYTLGLHCIGRGRMVIDGEEVIPFTNYIDPSEWERDHVQRSFEAGKPQKIQLEYLWQGEVEWRVLRLAMFPVIADDPLSEAEKLAGEADVVVVIAGLTNEWETEGQDRLDMRLPGKQDELISRISAVNSNTVVVLNAGSPLEMPWVESVKAILQLWYPGQESGHALADVLFGKINPSGKLPITFPVRLHDNPAYLNFPGENGKVLYGEGLYVGYRYYDKKDISPLFPFGYGLSYANFEYQNLKLSKDVVQVGEPITVNFEVTNQSTVAGKEVVQVYVSDSEARLSRPAKALKAFKKIYLKPGETRDVSLQLDPSAFSFYDPAKPGWIVEPGIFEVLVAASSRDIRLRETLLMKEPE